jgi:arginine/lysine/ornithine decarboxylase
MEIILGLLQDNAIISNVISIVVLGVLGIITKLIISSIGSINTQQTELLKAKTSYERIDKLAEMVELQSKLYKDAVVGSNLPATTKSLVLEDYSKIQNAYKSFIKEETKPIEVKEAPKPIVQQVVEIVGQDVLSKLREQLK